MKKINRLSWWQKLGLFGGLLFAFYAGYIIVSGLRLAAWNYMVHWERESFYSQLVKLDIPTYAHMPVACMGKWNDADPRSEREYEEYVAKDKECQKYTDQKDADSKAAEDVLAKAQAQVSELAKQYRPK